MNKLRQGEKTRVSEFQIKPTELRLKKQIKVVQFK